MRFTFCHLPRLAIPAIAIIAILGTLSSSVMADVISPKKQLELQISASKIICKEEMVRILKNNAPEAVCVTPATAERLVRMGWAKPVEPEEIELVRNQPIHQMGEIKKIAVLKEFSDAGRLESEPRVKLYNFVFQLCSGNETIRSPEVYISSDSEVKTIKIPLPVSANKCYTSVSKINAANHDLIQGMLVNKGGISDKINELEQNVSDLKTKLQGEKDTLSKISDPTNQKAQQVSGNIITLRKELNNNREELNRYQFLLSVNPKQFENLRTGLPFEGKPIEGVRIEPRAYYKQLTSEEWPYSYNVVFDVCTKDNFVKLPLVKVSSDTETKIVKLADKISPHSCTTSSAIIKIQNVNSLSYTLGTTPSAVNEITDLESRLDTLGKELATQRQALEEIINKAQKPADYEEQVNKLSEKIIDLRDRINHAKSKLHNYLYKFYQ